MKFDPVLLLPGDSYLRSVMMLIRNIHDDEDDDVGEGDDDFSNI